MLKIQINQIFSSLLVIDVVHTHPSNTKRSHHRIEVKLGLLWNALSFAISRHNLVAGSYNCLSPGILPPMQFIQIFRVPNSSNGQKHCSRCIPS